MELAILLALAASFCTATSSIGQRVGARRLESGGHEVHGFDPWLVFRLAKQPAWLLGFAAMIAGFVLQVAALHFGPLALVQPILTVELLFVFGYLAMHARCRGMRWHEWLAAVAMSAGVSVFLRAASPSAEMVRSPQMAARPPPRGPRVHPVPRPPRPRRLTARLIRAVAEPLPPAPWLPGPARLPDGRTPTVHQL